MPLSQRDELSSDLLPTLLLVDDDEDDYYLLQQAIETQSPVFTLVYRSDATNLLEWLAGLDRVPNLILLDFHLPQTTGLELITLLKQHTSTRDIPIIMWTTFLDDEQKQQCIRAKASMVLLKPTNQAALIEMIGQFNQRWFPGTY